MMEIAKSGAAGGGLAAAGHEGEEAVSEEDRRAFDTAHAGARHEGAGTDSHAAPSLTTLPPEIRGQIMQETMTAPPDVRSQAAAFRSADNLRTTSPAYSGLVANPSLVPGKQFEQLASTTRPQRAREAFRGHVNDLNTITDKGERKQKIETIHGAAVNEYGNDQASLSSLESAHLADKAAEKTDYHKNKGPFARLGQSPTVNAAQRALDATDRGPNASMMGEVLDSDEGTSRKIMRGKPVTSSGLWAHQDRDPNFSFDPRRLISVSTQARDGVTPEWQESHAYRTTDIGQAKRDFERSPAHGHLSRDTDGQEPT